MRNLGNTRITYTPTAYSQVTGLQVRINQAVDYFPYGKVLREYRDGQEERYLTTQHERDVESGLDYRGARYYDSDVARFLSIDPLASKFPAWSTYNYVMGNPIILIDPTGKAPEYKKEEAEAMASRGKKNGYKTEVVENPDKEGDYGVNYERTVDGVHYESVQFEGKFDGIVKGGLKPLNNNSNSSGSENGVDVLQDANNINNLIGSGSGVIGGTYGITANQGVRYAQQLGGKVRSASTLSRASSIHHLNMAKTLGKISVIGGALGVVNSGVNIYNDYNSSGNGFGDVNGLDVSNAFVGGVGVAVFFVSNPFGWVAGIGVGVYFGARAIYDLTTEE